MAYHLIGDWLLKVTFQSLYSDRWRILVVSLGMRQPSACWWMGALRGAPYIALVPLVFTVYLQHPRRYPSNDHVEVGICCTLRIGAFLYVLRTMEKMERRPCFLNHKLDPFSLPCMRSLIFRRYVPIGTSVCRYQYFAPASCLDPCFNIEEEHDLLQYRCPD